MAQSLIYSVKMLDIAPVMKDGRTLVPVRAISEALVSTVEWDSASKTVKITDNSGNVDLSVADKYVTAWKTAYSDFLKKQEGVFTLIYLTNDDIPEIVTADEGGYAAISAKLYTYVNGEVKQIDWQAISLIKRSSGILYYKERSGRFAKEGVDMGYSENCIFYYDNDKLTTENVITINDARPPYTYSINGKKASSETCNKEWEKLISGYKKLDYDIYKPITEANINNALK